MTPYATSSTPGHPGVGASTREPRERSLATLIVVALTIGALYVGRDILIPFALAILLSFALAPLVVRLRRVGVPRVPAVRLTVTLAFADEVTQGLERSTAASGEPVAGAAAGEVGSAEKPEGASPRSRRSARGA